jgi:hypothetical protein
MAATPGGTLAARAQVPLQAINDFRHRLWRTYALRAATSRMTTAAGFIL